MGAVTLAENLRRLAATGLTLAQFECGMKGGHDFETIAVYGMVGIRRRCQACGLEHTCGLRPRPS